MKKIILSGLVLILFFLGCKKDVIPTEIKTIAITDIDGISVNVSSEITNNSGTIMKRGVCYSTVNTMPTINDSVTSDSVRFGVLQSTISNLNTLSTYYMRAYVATNSSVIYGNTLLYKTASLLKDAVYYTIVTGGITSNYNRDKATVLSDTLVLKLYYQNTDSFTISRYCSSKVSYNYSNTSDNWYKYTRIGNIGLSYVLVSRKGWYALSGNSFFIKMSNKSYDDAYLTPFEQIACSSQIE